MTEYLCSWSCFQAALVALPKSIQIFGEKAVAVWIIIKLDLFFHCLSVDPTLSVISCKYLPNAFGSQNMINMPVLLIGSATVAKHSGIAVS